MMPAVAEPGWSYEVDRRLQDLERNVTTLLDRQTDQTSDVTLAWGTADQARDWALELRGEITAMRQEAAVRSALDQEHRQERQQAFDRQQRAILLMSGAALLLALAAVVRGRA